MSAYEEGHRTKVVGSSQEAEEQARGLEEEGWSIYEESAPALGQKGYFCVRVDPNTEDRETVSIRWNIYKAPLTPTSISCPDAATLFSFVFQHAKHQGFESYEQFPEHFGFICPCKSHIGASLVLHVKAETVAHCEEACWSLVDKYLYVEGDDGLD